MQLYPRVHIVYVAPRLAHQLDVLSIIKGHRVCSWEKQLEKSCCWRSRWWKQAIRNKNRNVNVDRCFKCPWSCIYKTRVGLGVTSVSRHFSQKYHNMGAWIAQLVERAAICGGLLLGAAAAGFTPTCGPLLYVIPSLPYRVFSCPA